MKTRTAARPGWWDEVLRVLVHESDRAESDRKLKRRIREKGLGRYDQARVDRARAFVDDVRRELYAPASSAFFRPVGTGIAVPEDWQFERLKAALARRHPRVPRRVLGGFLWSAIYLYYLR